MALDDGLAGFDGPRRPQFVRIVEYLENRDVDRRKSGVAATQAVPRNDMVDHGAQTIQHRDEAELVSQHRRHVSGRLARPQYRNRHGFPASAEPGIAHTVDHDRVGARTLCLNPYLGD
jgi:hypothetical protein